jgi:glyoxylase-like metal-dependent hydrolase (beta-lactamase superfamily II)
VASSNADFDPQALPATAAVQQLAAAVWRIVAPNPSPLTGPGTNTYVVGRGRPVVIDPGCDDRVHLERVLEVAGGVVERIVCTHSHPDHSPGAVWLRDQTGAAVCGLPAPDDGHQDPTYAPDAGLADGERIEAGGEVLRAVHTPGHASNHVCLLLEEAGLLFTGDHLMSGSTVIIIPPDGSMRLYLDSLRQLRELPVRALAPGHGALMPGAIAEIERVIRHRLAREAKLVRALGARSAATLDDVLPEVYDDVPEFMHVYARYSLLAHALKLVEEGRAHVEDEVYRWRGD